jgi:NADH pyrophosphatase NudC (nudix superfamily)
VRGSIGRRSIWWAAAIGRKWEAHDGAGSDIRVDGAEITEAAWFRPSRLPALPPAVRIARRLIDTFVAGRAPFGALFRE